MKIIKLPLLLMFMALLFGSCQQDQALQNREQSVSARSTDDDDDTLESDSNDEGAVEIEIEPSTLPEQILQAIQNRYPGAVLTEADQLAWDDGSITYDVEFELNGDEIEAMFDVTGNFLGEETDE
jgi:uncharacterized membrane protein YkoI